MTTKTRELGAQRPFPSDTRRRAPTGPGKRPALTARSERGTGLPADGVTGYRPGPRFSSAKAGLQPAPALLAAPAPASRCLQGPFSPLGFVPALGPAHLLASEEPSESVWQAGCAARLPSPAAALRRLLRSLLVLFPAKANVQVQAGAWEPAAQPKAGCSPTPLPHRPLCCVGNTGVRAGDSLPLPLPWSCAETPGSQSLLRERFNPISHSCERGRERKGEKGCGQQLCAGYLLQEPPGSRRDHWTAGGALGRLGPLSK